MIIARTIKCDVVEYAQNKEGFHGKAFQGNEESRALHELHDMFADKVDTGSFAWKPKLPKAEHGSVRDVVTLPPSVYKKGDMVATRKAYGNALALLGDYDAAV